MTRFPPIPVVPLVCACLVAFVLGGVWAVLSQPSYRQPASHPAEVCTRDHACLLVEDQYVVRR